MKGRRALRHWHGSVSMEKVKSAKQSYSEIKIWKSVG